MTANFLLLPACSAEFAVCAAGPMWEDPIGSMCTCEALATDQEVCCIEFLTADPQAAALEDACIF